MGRTAIEPQAPAAEPALNNDAFEVLGAKSTELVQLQADQASKAIAMARQIGYEGSLTVGTIEDEIRFYQRRSVESLLEAGKRLLVLRELCQFGTEFDQRVELLGFSRRTAYRFMQAAAKVAQSSNLLAMSAQVKNASAFLELITHDDEVLDGLQEMDDFDRMSASQLRQAARELQADKAATEQLLTSKDKKINQLTRQSKLHAPTDWPDEFKAPIAQAQGLRLEIERAFGSLDVLREQAMGLQAAEGEEEALDQARKALGAALRDAVQRAREVLEAVESSFDATLGALLD